MTTMSTPPHRPYAISRIETGSPWFPAQPQPTRSRLSGLKETLTRLSFALTIGVICVGIKSLSREDPVKIVREIGVPPKTDAVAFPLDVRVSPHGPAPHDPGGRLSDYIGKIRAAEANNVRVELRGTCVSACTMFLGAKRVCVAPEATFWFHSAYDEKTGRIDPRANHTMSMFWPDPVNEWAMKAGVFESTVFTMRRRLTGDQLIKMGVPKC